ncbi:MAG: hypothetical protein H7Z21_08805 [Hymenobacter sp.]|nr:hypothetical protein [Hymenobacter sp.]
MRSGYPPDPATLRRCADERWSCVRSKKGHRWLWWVEEAGTGQVLAFVFGRRTHTTFRRLLAVLATANWSVNQWLTDAWGAYEACLPADQRHAGKAPPRSAWNAGT